MHFIDKQDGTATSITILAGALDSFTNLFYPRSDGGNTLDIGAGVAGDHFSERGFPRPGGPIKSWSADARPQ